MDKWVEVNLDAIANNYQEVRNFLPKKVKILGVVKADAYGHGLVETSRELERQGVDYLGVTEVLEGVKLRRAGIKTPILVFGSFLEEKIYYLEPYDLTVTLNSIEMIKWIIKKDLKIKAHLKIETGLGRTGIHLSELKQVISLLKDNKNIEVEGIYTHLATAMWKDDTYAKKQFEKFQNAIQTLEIYNFQIPLKHICNSKALVKFKEMHLDMVRAGTILYGQDEGGGIFEGKMQNAWQLKAKIISLTELDKGHSVGYERTFILKRNSKLAIVPIGFSYGFSVEPVPHPKGLLDLIKVVGKNILRFFDSSLMQVCGIINGQKSPVIGKVGMQLTILDVTDIKNVKIGDTVLLPARRTNISCVVPKVYIKDNKPLRTNIYEEKQDMNFEVE